MPKKNKKLIANQKIVIDKFYDLLSAIELAKKVSYAKFDASIDLAFNLNLDVKQADQQLRGSIPLPFSTGKKMKLLALVETKDQKYFDAGADEVLEKFAFEEKMKKNIIDFDVLVTSIKMMPTLGKFGKKLGPKGLMPNLKTGTISNDLIKSIQEIKKGKANYRTDKQGNIHTMIGKVSMKNDDLFANATTIIKLIKKIKPSKVKGKYIKNLSISPTMGPSIKILVENI